MAVRTLQQLTTAIAVIAAETAAGANTKTRLAAVLQDISDSIASLGATDLTTLTNAISSLSSGKQATLISATNIKTINGSPILGSGDLTITGITTPNNVVNQSSSYVVPDFTDLQKVNFFEKIDDITVGDSSTITIPTSWNNPNQILPDSTKRNIITSRYLNNGIDYQIAKRPKPDLTAPAFVSAVTNSAGTQITITVSESIGAHTIVIQKNGSALAGTSAIVGATVQFTPSVAIISSDVLIANGTISDTASPANTLTLQSNQAIQNLVATAVLTPVVWTQLQSAVDAGNGVISMNALGSGGTSNKAVDVTQDFELIAELNSSNNILFMYMEETSSTGSYTYSGGREMYGVYYAGGNLDYTITAGGGAVILAISLPLYVRMKKSGNDIVIATSTNDTTYINRQTITGALTGKTTMYLKALFATNGTDVTMRVRQKSA